VKKSAGIVILEGLDEMVSDCQDGDPFFVRVVKNCTFLEEAADYIMTIC